MPSLKRPGVYVEEVVSQSNSINAPSASAGAFVCAHGRGPTVPTLVQSWTEYINLFGGFGTATQYLPYAVFAYFQNGGRSAWITRVVGTGAVKATRTLNDRAGTPLATLRVDAHNEGSWANSPSGIFIDIVDRNTVVGGVSTFAGRFDLIVKFGGTSDAYIVEKWTDLSMNSADARYVESVINGSSTYITVANLASATASPTNAPAAQVGSSLAGGADGAAPSAGNMSTAINLLDQVSGPLIINLPNESAATQAAAITYAEARGDSFVVCDTPVAQTAAQAVTFSLGLGASSYGAVYFPWVVAADPSSNSPGATRKLPPGGFVMGQYAATDALRGVQKAPAGINNRVAGVLALETKLTNTDYDTLHAAGVNALKTIPGSGICIFGARTLKASGGDRYVSVRRSLNYIKSALRDGTLWAAFEPNDETLWEAVENAAHQFLSQFWQSGGLRGSSAAAAFYVKCDEETNPAAAIANGEVRLEVGVAVQYPAEFVIIRVGQWEGGNTVQGGI